MRSETKANERRFLYVAFDGALGFAALALVVMGLLTFAPHNPLSPKLSLQHSLLSIAPEGWGFFSRNPHEERLYIYRSAPNGRLEPVNSADQRGFGLWAGASRRWRSVELEVGRLSEQLTAKDWHRCRGSVEECLEQTAAGAATTKVKSDMLVQQLCGEFVVHRVAPAPWAGELENVRMAGAVARVDIDCSKEGAR